MKYAVTPGLTLTDDGESGFRSGGGRSGGRQPLGVRDLLRRAPAVLRRRIRQLQLRRRLLGRSVLDCSTRAASAARRTAPINLPSGDNVYTELPGADDDSRRRQADRPRRQVLDRRDVRGDAGGDRATSSTARCASQQAVEPTTSYAIGRVRREFANQSSIGVHGDRDEPPAARRAAISCPSSALHRRHRLGCAVQEVLQPHRLRRGEPRQRRRRRRSSDLQEDSRHYYQRPDATSFALDPTRTSLTGSSARIGISKIGGQRVRFNVEGRVQVARLRRQRRRASSAAPTSAGIGELDSAPQRHAEPLVPQPEHQLQRVRGVERRRRSPGQRRQRQRARDFVNNW